MSRVWGIISAINGLLCVAFGAFGAHGLRSWASPELLGVWQTAVTYHFFHTLVLLVMALSPFLSQNRWASVARWCFLLGILLFSGSLYAYVLTGMRWLGPVTPMGGVLFMVGWAGLAITFWRASSPVKSAN